MGEYLKYKGQQVKIGTCEDLYYTTFQQFTKALKAGQLEECEIAMTKPEVYLKGFARFRFPFPAEDGKHDIGDYNDFWKSFPLEIGKGYKIEIAHAENCACRDNTKMSVVQQKLVEVEGGERQLQVVMMCPGCGEKSRLDKSEIRELVRFAQDNLTNLSKPQRQVIARAAAGYFNKKNI